MPIPVDDICVERRNSTDVTFFSSGIGWLASGEVGRRTVVASASTSGVPRVSSGGSSDMIVDCRSGFEIESLDGAGQAKGETS
jgi:hypothetical protein